MSNHVSHAAAAVASEPARALTPDARDSTVIPTDEAFRALVDFTNEFVRAQRRETAALVAENAYLRKCLALLLRPAGEVLQ